MDDGYFDNAKKTIILCTDNFTYDETLLLIDVLNKKFDLIATPQRRIKDNKEISWRIRFNRIDSNINKLRKIVYPYFLKTMYYKLNIEQN